VADSGPGIAPEQLPDIFEPFRAAALVRRPAPNGLGRVGAIHRKAAFHQHGRSDLGGFNAQDGHHLYDLPAACPRFEIRLAVRQPLVGGLEYGLLRYMGGQDKIRKTIPVSSFAYF